MIKFKNIEDVVKWRMCIGCGACVYACPDNKITMKNIITDGLRPEISNGECDGCPDCLKVCPGYEIDLTAGFENNYDKQIFTEWGPVIEVWEGYSADDQVRYSGSSAGLATILTLFCIEKMNMEGVLHIGADQDDPLLNKTYFSNNRNEIISRTGSRYSPASPCSCLDIIEKSNGQCVFIGKPCDVRGLRKAEGQSQALSKNVGVAISIFCAGTPSSKGTEDLLETESINAEEVKNIRYRGNGWPGNFVAETDNDIKMEQSYKNSWSFLQAYRPYRCHLCPEGTGDAADISCGDPWYREIQENEHGSSLILIRTERGRKILKEAIQNGYVIAQKVDPSLITKSQYNLLSKKKAIWGRLLAFRILGIPSPKLKGFHLFKNWLKSSLEEKFKSTFGTLKRIIIRKYYKPLRYH